MTDIIMADTEVEADMTMAKDIAETLHEHYQNWLWAVNVSGGVAVIKNLFVSSKWGYVLKYKDIKGDAEHRRQEVIKAGGELLERCHLPRGPRQEGAKAEVFEGATKWKPGY